MELIKVEKLLSSGEVQQGKLEGYMEYEFYDLYKSLQELNLAKGDKIIHCLEMGFFPHDTE